MDIATAFVAHCGMGVTPLPRRGTVMAGRDTAARMLRVSFHPEVGRVVVSIWDHDVCMATLRLAPEDVPELVRGLTAALLPPGPAVVPDDVPGGHGRTTAAIPLGAATHPASA